jgi:hypothetical protein
MLGGAMRFSALADADDEHVMAAIDTFCPSKMTR